MIIFLGLIIFSIMLIIIFSSVIIGNTKNLIIKGLFHLLNAFCFAGLILCALIYGIFIYHQINVTSISELIFNTLCSLVMLFFLFVVIDNHLNKSRFYFKLHADLKKKKAKK